MNQVSTLNTQSLLAMAAYAEITPSIPLINALEAIGMANAQATDFATKWTVVDSYDGLTGVGATVFKENATGKHYLATRGTQSLLDAYADYILATGIPSHLNPQFLQLQPTIEAWIANGTLPAGSSVTGHSLGGYLAAAIGSANSTLLGEVYMFNSPGVGGISGNVFDAFRAAFGMSPPKIRH